MTIARRTLMAGMAAAGTMPRIARAEGTPKRGGVLRCLHPDSPASMSLLEETTVSVVAPMMSVFNNLVVFDPQVPRNSMDSIIPELATSWEWTDGGKQLDFTLRSGVKWHDGKPFTSADVVHTWDLIQGRSVDKLRINPRFSWYVNVKEVVANGPDKVSFRLGRPQPALLGLLSAAGAPIYPAHVPGPEMRTRPIGTGPFQFAEYKRGEVIRLARNPSFWKPDRPYLDGVEWWIVPNIATAALGFVSGKFDMTFPGLVTFPVLRDILAQAPGTVVHTAPTNVAGNVTINHTAPPFDNPELRKAVALSMDRPEFIRLMTDGHGLVGGSMMPPPNGVWGLPPDDLDRLEFYGESVEIRREKARKIMAAAGYGPDKPLSVTVSTRNLSNYRDAGTIMLSQLRSIWIDATLELVETALWDAKMIRHNYTLAFNQTGMAVDEPDVNFFENYACGTSRNFGGYCDPEMDKLFLAQSMETDQAKRKQLVWEIDRKLQNAAVRPMAYHAVGNTCWHPRMHGLTPTSNSLYNGWRMENVWLDS
jgi:peptide/nickel transport system substrate-binding protein